MSKRSFQWFETAPVLAVVGGATLTGAILGALTTGLPLVLLYLWEGMSPYCAPWGTSARVSWVLQASIPGLIVGALWGIMAGLVTRWMANRKGGRAALGCLGSLLLVSVLIAVAVALVWFVLVAWSICE
jgi:hypothetical protein